MRLIKKQAFVLLVIIVLMALLGPAVLMLTIGSNILLSQKDHHYLQACQHNLVASGLAWARHHAADPNAPVIPGQFKLDTETVGLPNAKLTVVFASANGDDLNIRISTRCSSGRTTLSRDDEYVMHR